MSTNSSNCCKNKLIRWLNKDKPAEEVPLCDFDRISYEIRSCDVILIEGRSRVSEVIKILTQSAWSHSALYLGRLFTIEDVDLREKIKQDLDCADNEQIILEGILGRGITISKLSAYQNDHIRICRPQGLSLQDAQKVILFALSHLGKEYSMRHIFDLARFLLPWSIIPRRWRSSLFKDEKSNREICSSFIAEAFDSVHFPVLPVQTVDDKQNIQLSTRNSRLYTPRDFDYSPYFEIIKYPLFELAHGAVYRHLPWNKTLDDTDAIKKEVTKATTKEKTSAATSEKTQSKEKP
jgi:hypothetical protein